MQKQKLKEIASLIGELTPKIIFLNKKDDFNHITLKMWLKA